MGAQGMLMLCRRLTLCSSLPLPPSPFLTLPLPRPSPSRFLLLPCMSAVYLQPGCAAICQSAGRDPGRPSRWHFVKVPYPILNP